MTKVFKIEIKSFIVNMGWQTKSREWTFPNVMHHCQNPTELNHHHQGLVQSAHVSLQKLETEHTPILVITSVTVLIINNNILLSMYLLFKIHCLSAVITINHIWSCVNFKNYWMLKLCMLKCTGLMTNWPYEMKFLQQWVLILHSSRITSCSLTDGTILEQPAASIFYPEDGSSIVPLKHW